MSARRWADSHADHFLQLPFRDFVGTLYFEPGVVLFWDDWHKAACAALSIMTTQNQIEIFAAISAALSAELKELNAQCEKARSAETARLRNDASH